MKRKWVKKNGQKIWIKDLESSHLLNILSFLERHARYKQTKTEVWYTLTPGPQGIHAQDCFELEYDNLLKKKWTEYLDEIYWNIEKESYKRKLITKENQEKKFEQPNHLTPVVLLKLLK